MKIYIALFLALTAQRHFTGLIITTSHTMVANGDGVVFDSCLPSRDAR